MYKTVTREEPEKLRIQMKIPGVFLVLLTVSTALAASKFDRLAKGLPPEVVTAMDRIMICNEVNGSKPAKTKPSLNQVKRNKEDFKKYRCDRITSDEAGLRTKYAKDARVQKAFDKVKHLRPEDR